jgi:hypothetical protein
MISSLQSSIFGRKSRFAKFQSSFCVCTRRRRAQTCLPASSCINLQLDLEIPVLMLDIPHTSKLWSFAVLRPFAQPSALNLKGEAQPQAAEQAYIQLLALKDLSRSGMTLGGLSVFQKPQLVYFQQSSSLSVLTKPLSNSVQIQSQASNGSKYCKLSHAIFLRN